MDLIDYSHKVKEGPKYILICVNSFSREAFGTALHAKSAPAAAAAMSELLGRHPHPEKISTDMGQEFGAEFSRLLDREDIDHGIKDSRDHTSYAVMERAIQTIKRLLAYKKANGHTWAESLPGVLAEYKKDPLSNRSGPRRRQGEQGGAIPHRAPDGQEHRYQSRPRGEA